MIDKNSQKVSKIGEEGNKANLWKGGMGLSWLKEAVDEYPESKDVNSIVINIGTNGGFNSNEDIAGLVNQLKRVFPNAKLFAVQGSWGWGGNKNITKEIESEKSMTSEQVWKEMTENQVTDEDGEIVIGPWKEKEMKRWGLHRVNNNYGKSNDFKI